MKKAALGLVAALVLASLAPSAHAMACGCQDCHTRVIFGHEWSHCAYVGDGGATGCMDDIWGGCWLSGNFCGCIIVY